MRTKALCSVAIVLAVASMAGAVGIQAVPLMGTDTANTAQAMTPDGKYVVGTSGTANGYIFDTATQAIYTITNPNGTSQRGHGVGYRTHNGVDQLVVHGSGPAGWQAIYTYDLSGQPGSGTWNSNNMWLQSAEAAATRTDTYNTMAMQGFGSEIGYTATALGASTAGTKNYKLVHSKIDSTDTNISQQDTTAGKLVGGGISSAGVAGFEKLVSSVKSNWTRAYGSAGATQTNALTASVRGSIFAMAADGSRAFGFDNGAGTNAYAFDLNSSGTFTATYQLPTPGATSTSSAYGASADGKYAVGRIYNGVENATLWNLTNTAAITVTDLTSWASSRGVLGSFTRLDRAASIGVNGSGELVVSGYGTTASGSRAFVLTMPEPATLSFLAIGGLALLRRRR